MDVQESVHILCVVICITHKHACLTPVIQFGSHFLSFMNGNHCHFSKCSQTSRILCILSIEQCVRGFCSFCSHHNVIQLCCCGNHFTPEFFLVLWFKLPESTWLLFCPLTLVFSFPLLNFVEVFQVL